MIWSTWCQNLLWEVHCQMLMSKLDSSAMLSVEWLLCSLGRENQEFGLQSKHHFSISVSMVSCFMPSRRVMFNTEWSIYHEVQDLLESVAWKVFRASRQCKERQRRIIAYTCTITSTCSLPCKCSHCNLFSSYTSSLLFEYSVLFFFLLFIIFSLFFVRRQLTSKVGNFST